jgi:GT2 family glycosyltransferase
MWVRPVEGERLEYQPVRGPLDHYAADRMHDVAVIITSMGEAHWLRSCLPTFFALVVDIDDTGEGDAETAALLADRFPDVRRIITHNGGFAHANNVGLRACDARYVLLLNPDTEWVSGALRTLVGTMDQRPEIGVAGIRQLTGEGAVYPTMRRFTSVRRRLAEALYSERVAPRLGHRVLELDAYEIETACDWTIGSFMLCRREALEAAGWLDERYFFCSEEEDLCWRISRSGWQIAHLPTATIVHHVGKRGVQPRFVAQQAYAARQLVHKRDRPGRARAYDAAQVLYFGIRACQLGGGEAATRREAARAALRASVGVGPAPFREPPPTALPPVVLIDADRHPTRVP